MADYHCLSDRKRLEVGGVKGSIYPTGIAGSPQNVYYSTLKANQEEHSAGISRVWLIWNENGLNNFVYTEANRMLHDVQNFLLRSASRVSMAALNKV